MANAILCPSSGLILVSSGIFTYAVKSGDELAAVLAHEIAHGLANHARESKSTMILASPILVPFLLMYLVAAQIRLVRRDGVADPMFWFGLVYFNYMRRRQEKEADYIGTLLMANAGFDPSAALSFHKKMKDIGDDPRIQHVPECMATHPDVS